MEVRFLNHAGRHHFETDFQLYCIFIYKQLITIFCFHNLTL